MIWDVCRGPRGIHASSPHPHPEFSHLQLIEGQENAEFMQVLQRSLQKRLDEETHELSFNPRVFHFECTSPAELIKAKKLTTG